MVGAAAAVTVRPAGVVWLAEAAVPSRVKEYVPLAALPSTVMVSVELPPALTEAGTKVAATPLGKPLTEREIDSAAPDTSVVLIKLVPGESGATDIAAGLALMLKLFATGAANAPVLSGVPKPVGPS
jgi:hypothetical protein